MDKRKTRTPKVKKEEHPILIKIKEVSPAAYNKLAEKYSDWPTDRAEFFNKLIQEMSGCQECNLCLYRNKVVHPDGHIDSPIMVILEGPGFLEDLTKIPLTGPNELTNSECNYCSNINTCFKGKILTKVDQYQRKSADVKCNPIPVNNKVLTNEFWLRSSGAMIDGILTRLGPEYARQNWLNEVNKDYVSNFFFTNSVQCKPYPKATPETLHVQTCRQWVLMQWAVIQPKIIISLGRVSLQSITNNQNYWKLVEYNKIFETKLGMVIHQQHPAAIMREENLQLRSIGYGKLSQTFELAMKYVKELE